MTVTQMGHPVAATRRMARQHDTADRLGLARAVARDDRALLIDAGNGPGGWTGLADAAARGGAYAVLVRPDVLALDADDPDRAEAARRIAAELAAEGYRPVIRSSGQPGRLHLFVRVLDPARRDRVVTDARTAGIDVRRDAPIRPPGAPHRHGPCPEAEGMSPREVVRALRPAEACLSEAMRALLRHGERDGAKVDTERRRRVVWPLLWGMRAAGLTADDAWALFLDENNAGGAHVRERVARRGAAAERAHHDAGWADVGRLRVNAAPMADAEDARDAIRRLAEDADARPWPGRTGGTDHLVYGAVLRYAHGVGRLDVAPSERTLSLLTGRHRATVAAALRRLSDAGVLRRIGANERGTALWRIVRVAVPVHVPPPLPPRVGVTLSGTATRHLAHDAFTGFGLGQTAGQVHALLLAAGREGERLTASDLARVTGRARSTVARALARLTDHDLAVRGADRAWEGVDRDLDEVAAGLPGREVSVRGRGLEPRRRVLVTPVGTGARRAARYAVERRVFRDQQAEWAAERRRAVAAERNGPRVLDPTTGYWWPPGAVGVDRRTGEVMTVYAA